MLEQDDAKALLMDILTNLADRPIRSADAFRNAVLGGGFTMNPLLGDFTPEEVEPLRRSLKNAVAEGRMIDFGFLPNELLVQESNRARAPFEAGELEHPFDEWLGVAAWEGGMCGYLFTLDPGNKNHLVSVELYGVTVPNLIDTILVYDMVAIEVRGPGQTQIWPSRFNTFAVESPDALMKRGSNSLDPLVTMLRLLADASIPVIDRPAPAKLNKARTARGKWPIPPHTEVQTRDYVSAFRAAATAHATKGGHHASPIAHWRRSHMRHLSTGKVIPVRSTKVNWRDSAELHRLFYRVKETP